MNFLGRRLQGDRSRESSVRQVLQGQCRGLPQGGVRRDGRLPQARPPGFVSGHRISIAGPRLRIL